MPPKEPETEEGVSLENQLDSIPTEVALELELARIQNKKLEITQTEAEERA